MRHMHHVRAARGVIRTLVLTTCVAALSACDGLLEVDLPHLLTNESLEQAGSAEVQVNSAIALFECAYTTFGNNALGHEDAMQSIAGVFGGGHIYDGTANTGECGDEGTDQSWWDQIMGSRALLTRAPARLVPSATGDGLGVYDRIQDQFALGAAGERLSAIAAMYVAMSLTHMGEFLCEAALDGSDLLTPTDLLDLAETWVGTTIGHIDAFGDFVMPFGIASDARTMAIAIRARIRWANRDFAGAAADATTVLAADPTFNVWVTREPGDYRRNHIFHNATDVGYSAMLGVNDWWEPTNFAPNPATGQQWVSPIPFTGYIFLGVMPDGRTLEADNLPVRWAEEQRDAAEQPIPLGNGAVPDSRVSHVYKTIQGPGKHENPDRYSSEEDDIPYMTWEELKLIQADNELQIGGAANLQNAIDLVNDLRADKGLPQISGTYLTTLTDGTNDAAEVRYMLLEERKREFFAEGARYYSTKIQNTDLLWFPRFQGATPFQGYNLQGGVRQLMPDAEYEENEHFVALGGLDSRATGCASLFGSQAPVP